MFSVRAVLSLSVFILSCFLLVSVTSLQFHCKYDLQFFICAFVHVLKHAGQFEKGVAEGAVDPSFNPVLALRLSVLKDSAVWAILSEVSKSHTIPHRLCSHYRPYCLILMSDLIFLY